MTTDLPDIWLDLKHITTEHLHDLTLSQLRELTALLKSERRSAWGNGQHRRKLAVKISMVQKEIANVLPGAQGNWSLVSEGDLWMVDGNLAEAAKFYAMAGANLMARACRLVAQEQP